MWEQFEKTKFFLHMSIFAGHKGIKVYEYLANYVIAI